MFVVFKRSKKSVQKMPFAVVIAIGKAHDSGDTSTVYCLNLGPDNFKKKKEVRVKGNPFRLYDINGMYIWKNDRLRAEDIDVRSIVSFSPPCYYVENTGKIMEVSKVLSELQFDKNEDSAAAFRGIAEAFPGAVIAPSGYNQRGINHHRRPDPPYALISVLVCGTVDDRLLAFSRLGEKMDLKNRSRGGHKNSSIEQELLPVREPSSKHHVGDVILVCFGNKMTNQLKYEAICEGILLHSSPHQTEDITECMSPETPLIPCYEMTKNPRGYCLIINNMCFDKETEEDRRGAEFDESAAHQLFSEELHFAVHVKNDLQYFEIQQVLEEFAAKDHSDCDAFFCIIMSHGGERDTILGIKGKPIGIETLMSEYTATNCPMLAGKPKVFIIQACRGRSEDPFMRSTEQGLCADGSVVKFSHDSTLCRSSTPSEIDFLLAFSTVPGYISYRNKESGTLFIQTLVEVIRKYHTKVHLADMLTIVTNHVAERGSQVPQPSTTLRASLYL